MAASRTVIIDAPGGPEALRLTEREVGAPGPGEVLIRHKAVGLNYIDVYHRTGLYPLPLPHVLGVEASGVIEAVGDGVRHLKAGDRAVYVISTPGAYADLRVMPAAQVCPLPAAVSFETAAAAMLKGLTVNYLFRRVTPIAPGDTVLFHAAAGGVGLMACQWARSEGITLIGTAGSDAKCAEAGANGAAHVINYRTEDFPARVRELTGGKGVDVVMDAVGKDTFEGSLDCLRPFGFLISFGNASGPVPPVNLLTLSAKGSLKLTRQTVFTHIADPKTCGKMAAEVFAMVTAGMLKPAIGRRFPLAEVAEAHRALEARQTTGATILTL
jgi:NADPH2:quinone reductase